MILYRAIQLNRFKKNSKVIEFQYYSPNTLPPQHVGIWVCAQTPGYFLSLRETTHGRSPPRSEFLEEVCPLPPLENSPAPLPLLVPDTPPMVFQMFNATGSFSG